MSKPSLIEGLDQAVTQEQARALVDEFHTPKLDGLRASIPAMKTSELFGWLANPEMLALNLVEEGDPPEHVQTLIACAMVAICDEIDGRIPLPSTQHCDPDARGSFVPRVPRR